MAFVIGIDTTGYCSQSCVVLGSPARINALREKFARILRECGHSGELHWRRVRRAVRKKAAPRLAEALRESGARFFVFGHVKPRDWNKREFFLVALPNRLAAELEPQLATLACARETVAVKCDVDFDKVVKGGTSQFLYKLLKNLGSRLTGADVKPLLKRDYMLYLGLPGGRALELVGQLSSRDDAAVCVADLVLGLSMELSRVDGVVRRRLF
jgi:hypothetical protein